MFYLHQQKIVCRLSSTIIAGHDNMYSSWLTAFDPQLCFVVESFAHDSVHFACDDHLIIFDRVWDCWSFAVPFLGDFDNIVIEFESWFHISTIHGFIVNLFANRKDTVGGSNCRLSVQTYTISFLMTKIESFYLQMMDKTWVISVVEEQAAPALRNAQLTPTSFIYSSNLVLVLSFQLPKSDILLYLILKICSTAKFWIRWIFKYLQISISNS